MSGPFTAEQCAAFHSDGFVVLPAFYQPEELEPIQRDIHAVIGLVIEEQGLTLNRQPFSPETFDSGFQALIAHNRDLGSRVYDAVKQIPAFIRLVTSLKHEAVVRQVRETDQPGIAAGGYGIRIDNPSEEKFRAGWHQDYPAQIRSLDGLVFWSPLLPVTEELGPVEFCLGSHKDGLAPVHPLDMSNLGKSGAYGLTLVEEEKCVSGYQKVAPLTQPGDLVLIDFLTIHRSGLNRSTRSRWSMQMRWFNFEESTGRRLGWPGSFVAGNELRAIHPELVVD